jgi:hypothetical protein
MESEQLLAQALRAQAAWTPDRPPEPSPVATGPAAEPEQLAAGWVLLIALLLGLLGGAAAGAVSLL